MNTKQISISYSELISALKCGRNKMLPAEIHGFLCGLLCSGSCLQGTSGFKISKNLFQENFFLKPENQKIIARLMVISLEQLQDSDFEFQLILPDDDEKIKLRFEALSKWCQQFISGLGIGGINQKILDKTKLSEALYDISEIAKADYNQAKDEDSAEASYIELAEYVRIAVLTFFTEMFSGKTAKPVMELEEEFNDEGSVH